MFKDAFEDSLKIYKFLNPGVMKIQHQNIFLNLWLVSVKRDSEIQTSEWPLAVPKCPTGTSNVI